MRLFKKALNLLNKMLCLDNLPDKFQGNILGTIGTIYLNQRDWNKAFKNYKKAIKWNKKTENYVELGNIYHNIGRVYEHTKNYKKAFKAFIKALDFSKKFNKNYETDVITKSLKRIEPHLNSQEIELLKNIISKTT